MSGNFKQTSDQGNKLCFLWMPQYLIHDITFIKEAESETLQSSMSLSFVCQVLFQASFYINSLAPQKVKLKLALSP